MPNPLQSIHESKNASFSSQSVPEHFGNWKEEYKTAAEDVGLHDKYYRGIIKLTGADSLKWLNNFVTNVTKSVQPGEGNYTFALNTQGRILFDWNMLVLDDSVWLDLQREKIPDALKHLDMYLFREDVKLADRSNDFTCFGITGIQAGQTMETLGLSNPNDLSSNQHKLIQIDGVDVLTVRHDFAGLLGFDLWVPSDSAETVWNNVSQSIKSIGLEAVNALRIEAGIPWTGSELNDSILPAETGQKDRAVCFTKGCYLGQEVVERMDSRGAQPRELVQIKLEGTEVPNAPTDLISASNSVGTITSVCKSPKLKSILGLGIIRATAIQNKVSLSVTHEEKSISAELVP